MGRDLSRPAESLNVGLTPRIAAMIGAPHSVFARRSYTILAPEPTRERFGAETQKNREDKSTKRDKDDAKEIPDQDGDECRSDEQQHPLEEGSIAYLCHRLTIGFRA
jgi:hypothetical protein